MGIEIPHKIFYTNNICIKEESRKNSYDEENLNPYVNKSIHFEELQKRIKYHRKNSAPEYLFDEKSRKLFYSILYLKKEEEKNEKENDNNIEKNNWKNDLDIDSVYKKKSYDMLEGKNNINEDEPQIDFVLKYYKKGEELRKSYMNQLINKGVWMPNMERKKYNSIIIFDWDDTLLSTSFLVSKGIFSSLFELTKYEKKRLQELQELVHKLLTLSLDKGDVYIITNADKGWVEYSSKLIYPSISDILQKIKIISAKNKYEKKFPGDSRKWKINAFVNLTKDLDVKKITNIICCGDSVFEIDAGKILASKFTQAFIKTIKFKEKPELDEVFKQIMLVTLQFNSIHSAVKNLTIRVEQKKKEE